MSPAPSPPASPAPSLAARAVRGSAQGVAASLVTLVLGFTRSALLARLLLPEHFGVVALGLFFIGLVARLRELGPDMALIQHPAPDERFFSTYATLRFGLDALSVVVLLALTPLLGRLYPGAPALGAVLPLLILAYALGNLSMMQEAWLTRELAYGPLAAVDVCASLAMTVIAPYLAWRGWGAWALVAEQLSGLGTRCLLTWGPLRRRGFWPGWDREAARRLWGFGKPVWVTTNLNYLLDRFDDFWVGTALGQTPLGFYSKAYDFARYPRRVLANALVDVFVPIFARLQGEPDRQRLSQAFYRVAFFLLRTGMLIAGLFALAMPEFIRYVIGPKWEPLLWTFRLMLLYTVLDPLRLLADNLLLAVGRPRTLRRVTVGAAAFFLPAVILGAALGGINGVALAADGMLLVAVWLAYRPLRERVDFSPWRLAGWPVAALALAWTAGLGAERLAPPGPLLALSLKLAAFALVFGGLLLALERDDYLRAARMVWGILRRREEAGL